jgi:hypothetical protein
MSEQARIVYQISAASSQQPESGAFQSRLGYRPFHIGSSDNADLQLEGADILPVHLRLLVTTTGQVMLSNLGGADSISLDSRPVAAFTPVHWKPGAVLTLGEYRLELSVISVEGDNGQIEHVLRSVITQSSEIVGGSDDLAQEESNGVLPKSTVLFEDDPLATDDDILVEDEVEIPPASDDETGDFAERDEAHTPAPLAAEPPPDTEQPFQHIADDLPNLPEIDSLEDSQTANTAIMPPSLAPSPETPHASGYTDHTSPVFDTLPKDWKQAGQLSIQLTVNPVTLVPGERVRVPVSIRNGHEHTLRLRVNVAGVPREWIRQPHTPLVIGPGEIGALDFIIQAPPDVIQQSADMLIRLSDYSTPDDALTLPLRLNFKSTPNLIGRLERARVTDDQPGLSLPAESHPGDHSGLRRRAHRHRSGACHPRPDTYRTAAGADGRNPHYVRCQRQAAAARQTSRVLHFRHAEQARPARLSRRGAHQAACPAGADAAGIDNAGDGRRSYRPASYPRQRAGWRHH